MKKTQSLSFLFVFPFCLLNILSVIGQTITCETSCPKAGEMFSMRTSSPIINPNGASAGINQVWDYSVITTYVSPNPILISYQPASSSNSASLHPQANLYRTTSQEQVGRFLTVNNNGVRRASPFTASVSIDALELPLPFTFGDTCSETVSTTSMSGSDMIVTTSQNTFFAYGSGTLILPSGSFPEVLAISLYSTETMTKNGLATNLSYFRSYYFYSQHISQYLLYSRWVSPGAPNLFSPHPNEFIDQIVVGLKDEVVNNNSEMVVSPNPSSEIVNVKLSTYTKGKIVLKNSMGQPLVEQNYEEDSSLNLSELPEGMYIITFVSDAYTVNKKIIVRR